MCGFTFFASLFERLQHSRLLIRAALAMDGRRIFRYVAFDSTRGILGTFFLLSLQLQCLLATCIMSPHR